MNLLGIDVGFSLLRPTTGMAWSVLGAADSAVAMADWKDRRQRLPSTQSFALAAIDGPLVSPYAPQTIKRGCESVFIRRPFHNRCKPGCSHFGTGLKLRMAALDTVEQIRLRLDPQLNSVRYGIIKGLAVVEAFPNAFLGVMVPDDVHRLRPT